LFAVLYASFEFMHASNVRPSLTLIQTLQVIQTLEVIQTLQVTTLLQTLEVLGAWLFIAPSGMQCR
jgi:hypothetical protein